MARLPRLSVPAYPHHIVQRGNNRQPIFIDVDDRKALLDLIFDAAKSAQVAVHGYVLMDNHFHLLATPETGNGLSQMMQTLGRRYVQRFNRRHQRSGTLWEGRYRATLLEPAVYLLPCMVYMDLNPVRAGLIHHVADYRWSSHGHYAGLWHERRLAPHAMYWQLGNTPFAREAAYTRLVADGIAPALQTALTDSVLKAWALGSENFIRELQKQTERRISRAKPGRPRIPASR